MQQCVDQSSKSAEHSKLGRVGSCQNIPRTAGVEEYKVLPPGSKEGTDRHIKQKFIRVCLHICV